MDFARKRSNSRRTENTFISDINRSEFHQKLKAPDTNAGKWFYSSLMKEWPTPKIRRDISSVPKDVSFTASVKNILNSFYISPAQMEKIMPMPFDIIVKKLKQLQLNAVRPYILEYMKENSAGPVPGNSLLYFFCITQ